MKAPKNGKTSCAFIYVLSAAFFQNEARLSATAISNFTALLNNFCLNSSNFQAQRRFSLSLSIFLSACPRPAPTPRPRSPAKRVSRVSTSFACALVRHRESPFCSPYTASVLSSRASRSPPPVADPTNHSSMSNNFSEESPAPDGVILAPLVVSQYLSAGGATSRGTKVVNQV